MDEDPKIVFSPLSKRFTKDGATVHVQIYQIEGSSGWSLEVVNYADTSIVWDDLFETDAEAFAEFERTVADEGMETFGEREASSGSVH